jgi:uncharacterized membrane protein
MLIWIHGVGALIALMVAIFIFILKKGTSMHRALGGIFVVSMASSMIISFWILGSGHLSIIHGLSAFGLYNLALGVYAIKQKPENWLKKHIRGMGSCCIALVTAGAGVLGRSVFQDSGIHWVWFLLAGLIVSNVLFVLWIRSFKKNLKK